ncbi:T9SS type A sorting domain-containing protein [Aureibaculum sp. 2210JD6-5]|uniref:T9SS type A sorting domain-containing protein n=1 Tax=Aureibaculum sp. 2210JD6-5 TaxID=3103957 RepID=UPI002AAC9AD5|nr:T9SS type A sorting domain-containing protein [Aureibaculum sp. 2210JD6-5]MDY7394938.1 T9SS type A sorting domain-containing protein [Aureibaculum sp. 2210JD6-5]
MFKKLLPVIFLLFTINPVFTQELPLDVNNPNGILKSKSADNTFENTVNLYENYFSSKDIAKKGSGYKPFKRWEYHWSRYLQTDGTIAPSKHLWNAWEQKQEMTKSAKAVSNWSAVGPFSQSSNSGQGRINAIFVDPNNANTIYVGAPAGGLWKSIDAGVNWTPLTDDLPQIGVSGIAVDPNNSNIIYISTGDDDAGDSYSVGVLKSTNGGATWSQTGSLGALNGDNFYPTSNEILIDPTNSNIVWVATGNGLFKSTDAGASWRNTIPKIHIRDFKLKPGEPNTIYAVSRSTFYRSTNGGTAFTSTATGLSNTNSTGRLRVEVTPAAGATDNVYVLATDNSYAFVGVYKSTDSGSNFTKTAENDDIFGSSQAWFDLAFAVSPTDANLMFVGVLDIWRSSNDGDNFSKINNWRFQTPSYTHADIHFLRYYNNILYAGTDGGVYKSTNNGSTFTDLTKNLAISQFYKLSVSKQTSTKMSGGLQDNGGFSLINNNWHNFHGGDGMDSAADPNNENTFYGFTQYGGVLTKTTDGGLSSTAIAFAPASETGTNDSGGNWVTPLVINKAGEIYAGYRQLYQLINNGWVQVSNHSFGSDLDAIEIDPSNSNNILVSRGNTIYISNNKGKTFTTRNSSQTGISGINISSIEFHHSNSNIVWITTTGVSNAFGPSSGHTGGGVYKSTDGGLTFTDISTGLPNESKFVVRHHPFTTNNSIYVGTALGVYHLNDDLTSWEVFSTNLPNVAVPDIEINPYDAKITAATYGRSVWQSSIPTITLPANEVELTQISSPNNNVTCGQITPKLLITNNGQNTLTSFTVNYNVDGDANQTFNWTGSIASNANTTIELPTIAATTEGSHILQTEIVLADDANIFNNSATTTFSTNTTAQGQEINTFNDANTDKWIVSDNNLWEIGTPTTSLLNNKVASGYITNPSGNYPDQTTSYLTSPCYDLSRLENPVLKFKMVFDLEENWDVVYVEYSTNQGADWQVLGTANDPNWYNSNRTNASSGAADDCQNCPGAQWTGTDTTLKEYSYSLSALNGESNVIFRFAFVSDPAVNNEGVVIDDFVIDATAILAVDDFEEGEFLIYPNPSTSTFNIKRKNTAGQNMNINIFDVTGKLIKQKTNIADGNYQLKMNGVAKGIYFLKINIDNKNMVKKLILQ